MVKNQAIAAGLALTVILDTVVQVLWKFSVTTLPPHTALMPLIHAAARQPWFLLLTVIAIAQFINWLMVLEYAELSYAKPIASLSYVTVCLTSAWLFHEQIGALKVIGIACVLAGVLLLSKSASNAAPGS